MPVSVSVYTYVSTCVSAGLVHTCAMSCLASVGDLGVAGCDCQGPGVEPVPGSLGTLCELGASHDNDFRGCCTYVSVLQGVVGMCNLWVYP